MRKTTYSERFVALRLHHQLTLLQLDGYKALARRLAYEPDHCIGETLLRGKPDWHTSE